jgi:hypothetical protein
MEREGDYVVVIAGELSATSPFRKIVETEGKRCEKTGLNHGAGRGYEKWKNRWKNRGTPSGVREETRVRPQVVGRDAPFIRGRIAGGV